MFGFGMVRRACTRLAAALNQAAENVERMNAGAGLEGPDRDFDFPALEDRREETKANGRKLAAR
jgi:hypothetical protein